MRSHGTKTGEGSARDADEMVFDGKDSFLDDGQAALKEQVVNPHDRASQRVFDRGEKRVASNVARGTVVIAPPRSWMAAASLKAPGSP